MNKISKKIKQVGLFLVFSLVLNLPVLALTANKISHSQVAYASGVSDGLNEIQDEFPSGDIADSQDVPELIVNIIKLLLFVAGALAVVFIIIGGYQYITSGGNEEAAEKGRKTLVNAVIGVIVVVLSYVIINVVVNTVSDTF